MVFFFFFQAEDGIRDYKVTGVQTCALPIFVRRCMTNVFAASYSAIRQLPTKVVENTKQIAVQVRRGEFMQIPGLRLGVRDNASVAAAPRLVQVIYFFLAVEIEPNQHWRSITVLFSKSTIGQKDSAGSFGNLTNTAILATPILAEAKAVLVVRCSLVHVTDRYFGYCTGEFLFHGDFLLATADCLANIVRFSTRAGRDPSVGQILIAECLS